MGLKQVLTLRVRLELRIIGMKGYSRTGTSPSDSLVSYSGKLKCLTLQMGSRRILQPQPT